MRTSRSDDILYINQQIIECLKMYKISDMENWKVYLAAER